MNQSGLQTILGANGVIARELSRGLAATPYRRGIAACLAGGPPAPA